ncbi:hypothetical protein D3C85_1238400 [compost metagenome]
MHTGNQISWRRPALHIERQVNRTLIVCEVLKDPVRQLVQEHLELFRSFLVDQVRRHLDFQMRTSLVLGDVEILHQEDQPEVGILQFELIARVAAHAASVPSVAGILDQARSLKQ